MKRNLKMMSGLAAIATILMSAAACGGTAESRAEGDCSDFKVAVSDDDVRRAALYAIENDKVDTDAFPNLDLSYLTFPALIQATGTDQFDVIESSLTGVPLARAKGVDLKIVALSSGRTADADTAGASGIYVRDNSDVSEPGELKGKKIGVTSFGSSSTTVTRILLHEKFGLDTALQGGDVRFVELDPAQLATSLQRGQIDAVSDFSMTAWRLGNDSSYRRIMTSDPAWRELTDHNPVFAAYQALASQVKDNPTCYAKFQTMLSSSVDYAQTHIDELAATISKETKVPAEYITFQWGGAFDYIGGLDTEWTEAAQVMWDQAAKDSDSESLDIQKVIVK